jgi:hypothetical protein
VWSARAVDLECSNPFTGTTANADHAEQRFNLDGQFIGRALMRLSALGPK